MALQDGFLSHSGISGGYSQNLYYYWSADTRAAIIASGYFDQTKILRVGDMITVTCVDDVDSPSSISDQFVIVVSGINPVTTTLTLSQSRGIDDNSDDVSITIDSNENVGIRAPSLESWVSARAALQVGAGGSSIVGTASAGTGGALYIGHNLYYDNDYKRLENEGAAMLILSNGQFVFYTNGAGAPDTLFTPSERLRINSDGNVGIGTSTFGTSAAGVIAIANGTAPASSPADSVQLYAEDVSSSSELKVRDEAGNVTTLSPHNFENIPNGPSENMAWAFHSERDGKSISVDMLAVIREVEKLSNKKMVHIRDI